MDFRFDDRDEEFRQEVRNYLKGAVWPELLQEVRRSSAGESGGALQQEFRTKLAREGWLGLSWPKEHGGREISAIQYYIAVEEFARYGLNPGGTAISRWGPTIMRVGTDEQKQEWLPRIISGEVTFATGYTEPGAGTDLAGLQTRAVQDGDEWVINGQKIYNSAAHNASHEWLLARTDPDAPKHRGLSCFAVPMDTPGITVRPLYTMGGGRTNETFFDNVRIPLKNLIGEKNRGWYHVTMALDYERLELGSRYIDLREKLERLVEYARTTQSNGSLVSDVPWVRQRLAWLGMQVETVRLFSYRAAWLLSTGIIPNYEASASKIIATETIQHVGDAWMEVMGLHGQLAEGSTHARMGGEGERAYRNGIFLRFGGGSNEAQRDIIARRGLGLPR